jgi:proteasome lid subunit RPN8/RPN11
MMSSNRKPIPLRERIELKTILGLSEIVVGRKLLERIVKAIRETSDVEEGGVLIGYLEREQSSLLLSHEFSSKRMEAVNFITSGPRARKSACSLHSDLHYQEAKFQSLYHIDDNLQHLGSWHSHSPNGLSTLSDGDIRSYRNILSSPRHNHDYYLSLLATDIPRSFQEFLASPSRFVKIFVFFKGFPTRVFEVGWECITVQTVDNNFSKYLAPESFESESAKTQERYDERRPWYETQEGKSTLKQDTRFFNCIEQEMIGLEQGAVYRRNQSGIPHLVRTFSYNSINLEYHYPSLSGRQGVSMVAIPENKGNKSASGDPLIRISVKPLAVRFRFIRLFIDNVKKLAMMEEIDLP